MDFEPLSPPRGQRYLFHYTDCAAAESIAGDEVFWVRAEGTYGCGMYATDIGPDEEYLEHVQITCFDGNPPELLDGVVVLVESEVRSRFEKVEESIYLFPADSPFEDLDLMGSILAWGCFSGGAWEFFRPEY